MAAALLAFSLSIDDYVITSFTAGRTSTFPIFIWGSARIGVPVQVNVIGTAFFLIAVGFVVDHDVPPGPGEPAAASPTGAPDAAPRPPPSARSHPQRRPDHGRHRPDAPRRPPAAPLPDHVRRAAGLGPDHEPRSSTAARARG